MGKQIKGAFLIIAASLIILSLVGCSGGNTSNLESQQNKTNNQEYSQQSSSANSKKTISDFASAQQEGVFVERADGAAEPVVSTYTSKDHRFSLYDGYKDNTKRLKEREEEISAFFGSSQQGSLEEVSSDAYLHISKASGERLLMVSSVDNGRYLEGFELTGAGYCTPKGTKADPSKYDSIGGVDTSSYQSSNAADIQAALDIFVIGSGTDYVICSKNSKTLDAEWHEGTSHKQGKLPITQPYVVFSQASANSHDVDIEYTKDGYAILDISSLPSGMYSISMNIGSGSESLMHYVIYVDD